MAVQLKVGSTTFTADESGSPTIANTLLLLPEEGLSPEATLNTFSQKFFIQIKETTRAALKTRLDETRAVLNDAEYEDVTIEYTSGSAIVELKTSDGTYTEVFIDVIEHWGKTTALLECTVRAQRPGVAIVPGGGTPTFEPITAQWEIEENVSGMGAMIAILTFQTKAIAIAYWDLLRNEDSTAFPLWLSPRFRQVSASTAMEQQPTGLAIADADFKDSTLIVTFKEMYATFHSNPAFADVKDVVSVIDSSPRLLDTRSGRLAGDDIIITGQIDFKINANSEFDSNNTSKITASELKSKSKAVITAIIAEAQIRYGDGGLFEVFRSYSPDVINGRMSFKIQLVQENSKITTWEETTRYRTIDRSSRDYDANGKVTFYDHPAGNEHFVTWDILIESLGSPSFISGPAGVRGKNWRKLSGETQPDKSKSRGFNNVAPEVWTFQASGEWEWIGKASEPHPLDNARETSAS